MVAEPDERREAEDARFERHVREALASGALTVGDLRESLEGVDDHTQVRIVVVRADDTTLVLGPLTVAMPAQSPRSGDFFALIARRLRESRLLLPDHADGTMQYVIEVEDLDRVAGKARAEELLTGPARARFKRGWPKGATK